MDKYALWAYLKAKPGKEQELEQFLTSALPLAQPPDIDKPEILAVKAPGA